MSSYTCAILGCNTKRLRGKSGTKISMACFPNPGKERDRFKAWVRACGSKDLLKLDPDLIAKRYQICRKHFAIDPFSIRVPKDACPQLYLPEPVEISQDWVSTPKMYANIKDTNISYPNKDILEINDNSRNNVKSSNSPIDECEVLTIIASEEDGNLITQPISGSFIRPESPNDVTLISASEDVNLITQPISENSIRPKSPNNVVVANPEIPGTSSTMNNMNNENTINERINRLCRICTLECNNMKNIYEKSNQDILEMLKSCTDVKVSKTHGKFYKTRSKNRSCNRYVIYNKTNDDQMENNAEAEDEFTEDIISEEQQYKDLGNNEFYCKTCQKTFVTRRQLMIHNRIHNNCKPYLCSICGVRFAHLSTLLGHNRVHTGEKPHKCKTCSARFYTSSALTLHIRRRKCINNNKEITEVNYGFLCHLCGQTYSNEYTLQEHLAKHAGQMMYNCNICEKGFTRKEHLKAHLRTHTGERPFSCPFCHKSFSQSGVLHTHLAQHKGKKHLCNVCGQSFPRGSHLRRHERIHTESKDFHCSLCDKKFRQKNHLTVHERTHAGYKPYKCLTCNMAFTQNITLKNHILCHTGERPFLCDICGISYTQAGRLFSHKKLIHGSKGNVLQVINDVTEISNQQPSAESLLQDLANQQNQTENAVLDNQAFEFVTEDGQTFYATFLILLPNAEN